MPHSRSSHDAIVLGGGPAGSAAAITLARAGWNVLLAETLRLAATPAFKIGESLPPAARPLLRDLGLESVVAAGGHLPSPGTVSVWGGDEPVARDFIRDPQGAGWHLDRPRFDADLRAAAASAGADLRTGGTCLGFHRPEPSADWTVSITAAGGAPFFVSAPWLIDATGRRALVATHQGAPSERDDAQVAFCAVFPPDPAATDARSWVESDEDGWWYATRLPDHRRLVAFFTDEDLPVASEICAVSDFSRRLAGSRHIRRALGDTADAAPDRVRRFPAGGLSRRAFSGPGWLAVGDASLAFDPLSSQGIFHALYTGLRGAQALLAQERGEANVFLAWDERLRSIRSAYLRHLAQCHATETRWPSSPFWRRRHSRFVASRPFRTGAAEPAPAATL